MSSGLSRVLSRYTKIGGLLQQNGDLEVQKFKCRLRKSKKGEKPTPEGVKNAMAKLFACQVSAMWINLKISRTLSVRVTITIQRLGE